MVKYHLRDARYNLAYGILNNFDGSLNQAQATSIAAFGENSLNHAVTLIEVAEIYNQYGYYRLSRELLSKAEPAIQTSAQDNPSVKVKYILALADAMIGQGFSNDGIALLRANESLVASRAVTKEVTTEDGKL
jgi:hypothetical protein